MCIGWGNDYNKKKLVAHLILNTYKYFLIYKLTPNTYAHFSENFKD